MLRDEGSCTLLCGGDKSTQQKDIDRAKSIARQLED
jgi:putative component of toxin-antitoxin plasmid stabilization module